MSRSRYKIFETEHPYFLTNTIVAWLPVFSQPKFVEIIFNSWRHLQGEGLEIFGYVIMENHLHWIARSSNLAEDVRRFKSFTARKIIDELERSGHKTMLEELRYYKLRHKSDQVYQLWQEGSHPEQIQGDEMMLQKL